jgi:cell wall-associated NlpC family hydrolase
LAKHRMPQQSNRGAIVARGALVAGAVTVGALAAPVTSAFAAPVDHATQPMLKQAKKPLKKRLTKAVPQVAPAARPGSIANYAIAPRTQRVETMGSKAAVIAAALSKTGSPYVYGAAGPNAFDCSGLVEWSMKQGGIHVPRDSWGQLGGGVPVSKADLQPGDIVIYNGGSHAALYIGGGRVVQAVTYGVPARVSPLNDMEFYAARRY